MGSCAKFDVPFAQQVSGGIQLRRAGLIASYFTEASRDALSSPHTPRPEAAEGFNSLLANPRGAAAIGQAASRKFGTGDDLWRACSAHEKRNLRVAATKPPDGVAPLPSDGLPSLRPSRCRSRVRGHKEKQTIRKAENDRHQMICSKTPTSPEAAKSPFFSLRNTFSALEPPIGPEGNGMPTNRISAQRTTSDGPQLCSRG